MPRIWQFGLVTGGHHQHPHLRQLQPLLRLEASIRTTQTRRRHHEPPRRGERIPEMEERRASAQRLISQEAKNRPEVWGARGRPEVWAAGQEPSREPRVPGAKNREYRQRGARRELTKTQLLFQVAFTSTFSLND